MTYKEFLEGLPEEEKEMFIKDDIPWPIPGKAFKMSEAEKKRADEVLRIFIEASEKGMNLNDVVLPPKIEEED